MAPQKAGQAQVLQLQLHHQKPSEQAKVSSWPQAVAACTCVSAAMPLELQCLHHPADGGAISRPSVSLRLTGARHSASELRRCGHRGSNALQPRRRTRILQKYHVLFPPSPGPPGVSSPKAFLAACLPQHAPSSSTRRQSLSVSRSWARDRPRPPSSDDFQALAPSRGVSSLLID